MSEFGAWLARQRKIRGLTQESLAERLEVHTRSVTQWEAGRNRPNRNTLRRIARFFDLEEENLIAAVFAKGKLPDTPATGAELKLPFYLSERVRQAAERSGAEVNVWLSDVMDWIDGAAGPLASIAGVAQGAIADRGIRGGAASQESSQKLLPEETLLGRVGKDGLDNE